MTSIYDYQQNNWSWKRALFAWKPDPQAGNRMRPTETMDLASQALIRDWIQQLNGINCASYASQLALWPAVSILDLTPFINAGCSL